MSRRDFKHAVRQAACNPQLALALERATSVFAAQRAKVYAGVDFKAVQAEIGAIKAQAIESLPDLLAQFKEEATKAGATVHEARDAAAARQRILEIVQSRQAKRVVKSKSMLTEEIELNKTLAKAGIDVVETDLGEWIIQLAGERPSHFVGPAMHKTREEVAELFSRVVGRPLPSDPEVLVRVARQELRQAFISADVGISGANIAIADTGTLVIVTNEGNSRLVTTLPPVHIAVVGIEKIVPDLMTAAAILKYLPKSAAGQKITSYVSFITGPSRTADIELTLTTGVHGPKEVHIVLVDNGRNRLRDDAEFREALHCVKCGACLNVCPVFRVVGGHVFGHVYQGGIGAILTAFHDSIDAALDPLQLCAACHRCADVCTAGIDIPRLVVALRRRAAERRGLSRLENLAFRRVLAKPQRFQSTLKAARKLQNIVVRKKPEIERLPLLLSSLTSFRSLPRLAEVPFRDRWTEAREPASGPSVAFFAGCLIDFAYPEIGEAVTKVLRKRGARVAFPMEQACCGLPAIYAGDDSTGRALARRNVAALESANVDYVVTACPTCATALRREFPRLLAEDGEWKGRAARLAARTHDFSEFLVRILKQERGGEGIQSPALRKVTYHDSCHLLFGLGLDAEPRQLIAETGSELVEMDRADACCGCAGTFSLKFPEVSRAMLDSKLAAIEATGAEAVLTGCPACLLQIRGGLHKRASKVKVIHLAEALARLG